MSLIRSAFSPASVTMPLAAPYAALEDRNRAGTTDWTGGETAALRFPAVYAAVRLLAESVAMSPLLVYRRHGRDRDRVSSTDDPRAGLLATSPNPEMTAFELWEAVIGQLNLWGNAYLYKQFDTAGRVMALWPLPPSVMQDYRDADGTRWYVISTDAWSAPGLQDSMYRDWEIVHLRGFGTTGYRGVSPLSLHRQAVRLGQSAADYAERTMDNDARPGGVLEVAQALDDTQFARLKAQWDQAHRGTGNAHRVAVLEGGAKWTATGMPPADMEFIAQRKMQVTEIARVFRVPPHMIGDLDRATFSNIEQQSIEFVTYSLQPWLTRLEQRLNREVFGSTVDRDLFCEFLIDGLLRGDTTSRFAAYAQADFMTKNEKRRRENLPAVDGGDALLDPLNMTPAGMTPPAPGGTG